MKISRDSDVVELNAHTGFAPCPVPVTPSPTSHSSVIAPI